MGTVGVAVMQLAVIQGSDFHMELCGSRMLGNACQLCVLAEGSEELHRWRSNKRLSAWRHELLPLLPLDSSLEISRLLSPEHNVQCFMFYGKTSLMVETDWSFLVK